MSDRPYAHEPGLRRRRNLRIALLVVGALALFVTVLVFGVMSLTRPVVDAGDSFMTALKESDFPRAYALATPELQRELGSVEVFAKRAGPERPATWSWSSRSIRNGTGRVGGAYTRFDGRAGRAEVVLHRVDGQWRVTAFRLAPD
ncbi:MAG: hypothetical protein QOJ53_1699 [Sphingomonadales bacterium]|jgi:hypothetical protein|nr:hypothetical protein [Sphingomonadales bacterium]MEA3043586.1 hypothetical protein [Sphingomonadales bacterium]MEA3047367.1 hypothetical protein [Sphingomonadales bacterium]